MGCLPFDEESFVNWTKSYKSFLGDIEAFLLCIGSRAGIEIKLAPLKSDELDGYELSEVRNFWLTGRKMWLKKLQDANGTKELSQKKLCAILLWFIVEHKPFILGDILGGGDPDLLKSIQDGKSAYLGWMIIYEICDFYEVNREAKDEYVPRVTEEFEIDFVSNLLNGYLNERSIHLALKALFLRDI